MKVVKQHSTFLQNEWDRHRSFPKGLFVDIFPADRYAPEGILRKKQKLDCMISMLFTREYTSKSGGIVHAGEKVLLSLPKAIRAALKNKADKAIRRWNSRTDLPVLVPTTIASCRKLYPADMFDVLEKRPFQEYAFYVSGNYEGVLNASYKDYKTLPPEEKRVWTHHPILLDFEHDYEELQ
jgi:lipopolysaccharide cholinephosphotransferase